MSRWMPPLVGSLLLVWAVPGSAADNKVDLKKRFQPTSLIPLLTGNNPDALAGSLRGYLAHNLPKTLYEASPGWGETSRVARGVKWRGIRPQLTYGEKNDGTWRKIRATADNLPDTLVLDIRNLKERETGRLTFDVFLAFDLKLHYEQQNWESGVRLYSGSARARVRVKVLLGCEMIARLEDGGSVLPDAVFRLRVARARVDYDNLAVEHIAGLGGEAAQLIGDTIKGSLDKWHPSLERELMTKASAAIVKSADTKEVRLSVAKLLNRRGPPAAQKRPE